MDFQVMYEASAAGVVSVEQDVRGSVWKAVCTAPDFPVLRLYGLRAGCEPLRIGVLVPQGDTLVLEKTLSWDTLQNLGYDKEHMPEQYRLAEDLSAIENREMPVETTGYDKIDRRIAQGTLELRKMDQHFEVCAPFVAGAACELAFALTACNVQNGLAILPLMPEHKRREMTEKENLYEIQNES